MNKLNYYIADANGTLEKFSMQIKESIGMAESYAISRLKPKSNIDIIFSVAPYNIIVPETHIGARTYSSTFIIVALDIKVNEIKNGDVFQTICHELCHAVRWQYNDEWSSTLLDGIIFEGLATAFEIESAKGNNITLNYFAEFISKRNDNINEKILKTLDKQLNDQVYDYDTIFFTGDKELGLPRWSGYSLGYYLVKKYMVKHNKKIAEIFHLNYSELAQIK
jgi:uncharacterized protein YjaZ